MNTFSSLVHKLKTHGSLMGQVVKIDSPDVRHRDVAESRSGSVRARLEGLVAICSAQKKLASTYVRRLCYREDVIKKRCDVENGLLNNPWRSCLYLTHKRARSQLAYSRCCDIIELL